MRFGRVNDAPLIEDLNAGEKVARDALMVVALCTTDRTTWGPACDRIAPLFDQLAAAYPDVLFAKVTVPTPSDLGRVPKLPAFLFRLKGATLEEFMGGDMAHVEASIRRFRPVPPTTSSSPAPSPATAPSVPAPSAPSTPTGLVAAAAPSSPASGVSALAVAVVLLGALALALRR